MSWGIGRAAAASAGLWLALAALFWAGVTLGDYPVAPLAVLRALAGHGDPDTLMVVTEWRLPRAAAAPLLGAALGMSGAIFQALLRNPLASPDVIGFDAGAQLGAVLLLIGGAGAAAVGLGALGGGLVTAAVVQALARGRSQGLRLILIGIGVGQLLFAAGRWVMLHIDPETTLTVATWGAGSLNGITAAQTWAAAGCGVVLGLAGLTVQPWLRQMELGAELARSTGLALERAWPLTVAVGVALTAMVTAIAGPIGFIALTAPHLARLLAGPGPVAPGRAALAGAVLLAGADLAAQHALAPRQLPVGVVTLALGGLWFAVLLSRAGRRTDAEG